jgi:hypothetical protein
MVNFFVTAAGMFGIRNYLETRGIEMANRVQVVLYEEMASLTQLPIGGTIFAALDQVSPTALAATAQICDQLCAAKPAASVLNNPTKVFGRYDLLRRLFKSGCNRFNAIRAGDDAGALRYPVFIRREHSHNGSLTPLLHDRLAVDRALGELVFRGVRVSDLLIVEFCDTSGADGLFRKYSAMRVGDVIVPRHLHASKSWIAKSQNSVVDERLVREELEYVNGHPHAGWLADVFKCAHIEYGRIDYGIYQGQPQVWEINLNPTFGRGSSGSRKEAYRQLCEPSRTVINQQLLDAFKALEVTGPVRALPIVINDTVRKRLRSEVQARRRAVALAGIARAVVDSQLTRVLKKAIRPAIRHLAPTVARLARHRV